MWSQEQGGEFKVANRESDDRVDFAACVKCDLFVAVAGGQEIYVRGWGSRRTG
jgi:hypothetical protein